MNDRKGRVTRNVKLKYLLPMIIIITCILSPLISIPSKIIMTLEKYPNPQAIFVLGGFERASSGGELWQKHPEMDVWLSDFQSYLPTQRRLLLEKGVPPEKMKLDGNATDTVTHFTTLVEKFNGQNLKHLYMVTSKFHIERARVIASIVLGSRGIVITPYPVNDEKSSKWYSEEHWSKSFRDCLRSILWIYMGKTGASFNHNANGISK